MSIPALVIAFNRPEKFRECLQSLSCAGIRRVFVHFDGPRDFNRLDKVRVSQCISILEEFTYLFESVEKRTSSNNLGCGVAVSTALDWFFSQNEHGLVIEDDIRISGQFVEFCDYMLNEHRDNKDVWHINGWVPFNARECTNLPFRTRYLIPWGWATWANRWINHSTQIYFGPLEKASELATNRNMQNPKNFDSYWNSIFQDQFKLNSTWDYQWQYTIWKNGGMCISPPHRLTSNHGFDEDSTHTTKNNFRLDLDYELNQKAFSFNIQDSELLDSYLGKLFHNLNPPENQQKTNLGIRFAINKYTYPRVWERIYRSIFYPGILKMYFTPKKRYLFLRKMIPFIFKKMLHLPIKNVALLNFGKSKGTNK